MKPLFLALGLAAAIGLPLLAQTTMDHSGHAMTGAESPATLAHMAVSYTHLDVYKRQGLYGLLCVALAGLYGAATVSRRILVVQTVPAAAALIALLAGW